jgi:hypothetical protein
MPTSKSTIRAITRYTESGCIRALILCESHGEGPHTIALTGGIQNVTTVQAANAAINAGREILQKRRVNTLWVTPLGLHF